MFPYHFCAKLLFFVPNFFFIIWSLRLQDWSSLFLWVFSCKLHQGQGGFSISWTLILLSLEARLLCIRDVQKNRVGSNQIATDSTRTSCEKKLAPFYSQFGSTRPVLAKKISDLNLNCIAHSHHPTIFFSVQLHLFRKGIVVSKFVRRSDYGGSEGNAEIQFLSRNLPRNVRVHRRGYRCSCRSP